MVGIYRLVVFSTIFFIIFKVAYNYIRSLSKAEGNAFKELSRTLRGNLMNKSRLHHVFTLLIFFMVMRLMADTDTYGSWPIFKDYTINTSPTGANVAVNLIKFPLLIRLSTEDSTVFNQAQSNGADIRFSGVTSTGGIGTHYRYQKEFWDKTNKIAAFWVLVDTLKGNSTTQKIRLFCGNSTAGDSSKSSAVFDTANGFQGVWHFSEGNNTNAADATINGYTGTSSGTTPPADTAGVVGRCRKFDGASSYFALNGTAGGKLNFPEGGRYTLSAWVNTDSLYAANKEIISKGDHQYSLKISNNDLWLFTEFNNTAGWQSVFSSTAATTRAWHHIVGVRNGANEAIYVDGLLMDNTISAYSGNGRVTTFAVNIGKWPDNADRFFDGKIDEVEMSNVARDSNWIKASYQNQKSGSTILTPGPLMTQAPASLTYARNPDTFFVGVAVADTPSYTGTVDSFTVSPSLAAVGLVINKLTGIISGTPATITTGPVKFVVTAANGAGSTTDTLTITVNTSAGAPSISAQSGNVWAGISNAAARVWVKAAGTAPLTYQWFKNGLAIAAGLKDTLKLDTVKRADDNLIYLCKVTNGVATVSSVPCTLHVVAANFSASPVTGKDTLTVTFADSSLGNTAAFPMKWSWSFDDGGVSNLQNPVPHFYSRPNTYTVKLIVTANGIADSMKKTITITALPLKAVFKADTTTAPSSLTVTFSDLSTGTVYTRLWSFGDGTTHLDSSRAPVTYTYTKAGNYLPMLTVRGPAGADSATLPSGYIIITDPTSHNSPLQISGRYSANKTIAVVFSGYSAGGLRDSFPPLFVKKIELWSKKNALPVAADTMGALPLKTYTLSQLKASATQFTDVIPLSGTYSISDSLGLMSDILWNDGVRSPFGQQNGSFVSLRDTAQPVNPLVISGIYAGGALADIYLDGVSSLDTTKDAYVFIQYDFIDSINFSSNLNQLIPVSTVIAQSKNNKYTFELSNPLCAGAYRPLYCAVSIKGVNAVFSPQNMKTIPVGNPRPGNPIHLQANKLSPGSIQLQWTAAPSVDSMRIWYSSQKPVPLSYDIPEGEFLKKYVSPTAASDIIAGLDPNTTYFFGAQVESGNLWSSVTDSSIASAKTDTASGPPVQNTIRLDTAYFDTSTNSIKAVITTDTTGRYGDTLSAGMSWSTDSSVIDNGFQPPQNARKSSIRPLDTVSVGLGDQAQFNTTYYVGMWLKTQNTGWAKPVNESKGVLMTPAFTWQSVTYGGKFPIIYVDNKTFRIRIDTAAYPGITDDNTIVRWQPTEAPKGFIPVSIGFEFAKIITPPPLNIGISYGMLPSGYTPSDVRIYRYDNGLWLLDRSPLSYENGYVSVTTRNIKSPFIAMIDIDTPSVEILSKVTDSVAAFQDVSDTFRVSDNIANLLWRFQSAKGGDAYDISSPTGQDTGAFNAYSGTVNSLIEADRVSADQGVRAILIVDDGAHVDTVNVSRRVIREKNSDITGTDTMKWVPLRVTAILDKPGASNALKALAVDSVWKYDITRFRLFRWYPYGGNAMNDSNKWVEYSGAGDSLFSFVPGRVAWIKTRRAVKIDFGRSVTPDLTRSDTLDLQPGAWTDIALPYQFDIRLGDIFDASRASSQPESLHVISYAKDAKTGKYGSPGEVYFYPDQIGDAAATLASLQNGTAPVVYSVYNQFASVAKLVIPPLPSSMSKYTAQANKKSAGKAWVLKVSGQTQDGTPVGYVYCGYSSGNPGKRFFPPAPALEEGANIRICDDGKRMFGYVVQSGILDKEGGVVYDLAFNNVSNRAERIHYAVEAINGLPRGMRAAIFDPSAGTFADAKAAAVVDVGAKESVFRQLAMGSETFLAKVKTDARILRLALINVYPNPFKRSMRIRFSVPAGGLSRVHFGIFNASGREVWNATVNCGAQGGMREVVWNGKNAAKGPAASGMYIVRMTALNAKGAQTGVFEKKIMYLP